MDNILKRNSESLKFLPIEKKAEIQGALPVKLSIKNIAKIYYLNDMHKYKAFMTAIVSACENKEIKYYGDINGWSYKEDYFDKTSSNQYPEATASNSTRDILSKSQYAAKLRAGGYDCLIHRDDFKRYLQSTDSWPIQDNLLENWWVTDEQKHTETTKIKQRKKLKPLVRETNEALLLIYELTDAYNVTYLDEMAHSKAWGLIFSKQFESTLIKSLPDTTNGSIILNGGEKLDKKDFVEKYRKRFTAEKAK